MNDPRPRIELQRNIIADEIERALTRNPAITGRFLEVKRAGSTLTIEAEGQVYDIVIRARSNFGSTPRLPSSGN